MNLDIRLIQNIKYSFKQDKYFKIKAPWKSYLRKSWNEFVI